MNLHFQLKTLLLIGAFSFLASTATIAQCNFSSQLERLEYIALKAIYNANPNNTLSVLGIFYPTAFHIWNAGNGDHILYFLLHYVVFCATS